MADFRNVVVPQDLTLVGPDGRVTPAWHRFLLAFVAAVQTSQVLAAETDGIAARVATIEGKPVIRDAPLDAVSSVSLSAVSVTSPAATGSDPTTDALANELKADVNALVADVNAAIGGINAILARLRALEQIEG